MSEPCIPPQAPAAKRVWVTAAILYGTLGLSALAVPQALVNWLNNFEPSRPVEIALHVAEGVQSVAVTSGANLPYTWGRAAFLKLTNKDHLGE